MYSHWSRALGVGSVPEFGRGSGPCVAPSPDGDRPSWGLMAGRVFRHRAKGAGFSLAARRRQRPFGTMFFLLLFQLSLRRMSGASETLMARNLAYGPARGAGVRGDGLDGSDELGAARLAEGRVILAELLSDCEGLSADAIAEPQDMAAPDRPGSPRWTMPS